MDQKIGLEAMISQEETRTTLTKDLREILGFFHRNFSPRPNFAYANNIRTMEDHMINAKISHSIETMEVDLEMHFSTIRMESGETMGTFLVLHRIQGETSYKIIHTANQELVNLTTLPSANLTTNQRLILHLTNKSSHKAIIRHHLMWFAPSQLTIPLMKYQISAR